MPAFLFIFALFLLGTCAVTSSPVPTGRGKGIVLFLFGVALWAGAYIIVRTNQESLMDFLSSDWALSGKLANQFMTSLVVFGFGWYTFIASSIKTERKEPTSFELLWADRQQTQEVEIVKVFRLGPGLLIWIPVVALLVAIWLVPAHFGGLGFESTVTPTPTITATNSPTATSTKTPTAMATSTPTATQTSIATPTSTSIATVTPEPTATPSNTIPNMPPLECGGEWLHQEPFYIGVVGSAIEKCPDGSFLLHNTSHGLRTEVFQGWELWEGKTHLVFTIQDGDILVSGKPFIEWLHARGGK